MLSCVENTPFEMEYSEMEIVLNKTVQRKPSILLADFSVSYDMRIKDLRIGVSFATSKEEVKSAKHIAWVQHVGYPHYEMSIKDVPFDAPCYAAVCAVTNKKDTLWSDIVVAEISNFDIENSTLNGHKFVDLGLPSGTLWAECNVGASNPKEEGDLFAWGEVKPKEDDTWETYKYCNGTDHTITKYNHSETYGEAPDNLYTLTEEDDAAHVLWGEGWRIPSAQQYQELIEFCNIFPELKGFRILGTNGNEIFLPGRTWYWTNSQLFMGNSSYPNMAYAWWQNSDYKVSGCTRCKNNKIRPVCKGEEK